MKRLPLVLAGLLLAVMVGTLLGAQWARWKLQKSLTHFLQIPVQIERVSLSPRRLTLHGVSLAAKGVGSLVPLKIEKLELEGAPWENQMIQSVTLTGLTLTVAGVPLQAQGRVFVTARPRSYAQAEGWLDLEHPFLRGRLEVSGRLLKPVVLGWLERIDGRRAHFVAQMGISREALRLERMEVQGGWNVSGSLDPSLPWRGDLSGVSPDERFQLQLKPVPPDGGEALLSIQRAGLSPQEISARWAVQRSRLQMESRLFNGQALLSGQVSLISPYQANLRLQLNGLDVAELVDWLPTAAGSDPPSGRLQGEVTLLGPLSWLASAGRLSGNQGMFGSTDFKWLSFNFRGTGPILHLLDSHLMTTQAGTLRMEGMLDLRRIGQPDFARGIRATSTDRALRETGWPVSLTPSSSGLKLGKADQEGVGLRADLDKDGEFVGVEHRKEF